MIITFWVAIATFNMLLLLLLVLPHLLLLLLLLQLSPLYDCYSSNIFYYKYLALTWSLFICTIAIITIAVTIADGKTTVTTSITIITIIATAKIKWKEKRKGTCARLQAKTFTSNMSNLTATANWLSLFCKRSFLWLGSLPKATELAESSSFCVHTLAILCIKVFFLTPEKAVTILSLLSNY